MALAAMHRSSPSSIREFLTRGLEQATNHVMLSLLNGLSLTTVHTVTMMNLVQVERGFDIPGRASQLVRVIDPCLSSAAGEGMDLSHSHHMDALASACVPRPNFSGSVVVSFCWFADNIWGNRLSWRRPISNALYMVVPREVGAPS
jgi:hypothetical protein